MPTLTSGGASPDTTGPKYMLPKVQGVEQRPAWFRRLLSYREKARFLVAVVSLQMLEKKKFTSRIASSKMYSTLVLDFLLQTSGQPGHRAAQLGDCGVLNHTIEAGIVAVVGVAGAVAGVVKKLHLLVVKGDLLVAAHLNFDPRPGDNPMF